MVDYSRFTGVPVAYPDEDEKKKHGVDYSRFTHKPDPRETLMDTTGPTSKIKTQAVEPPDDTPFWGDTDLLAGFKHEMKLWGEAIKSGYDESITGMAMNKEVAYSDPDMELRHAFIREISGAVIDAPVSLLTALPGFFMGGGFGAVVTSGAGNAAIRQALVEAYSEGGDQKDIAEKVYNTLKAGLIGGTSSVVAGKAGGFVGGKVTKMYGSKVAALAQNPTELALMSTTHSVLNGQGIPSGADFKQAALAMVAGKTVGKLGENRMHQKVAAKIQSKDHMETKLQKIYVDTGLNPGVVIKMAQRNPRLAEELLSKNIDVPEALSAVNKNDPLSKVDDGTQPKRNLKEDVKGVRDKAYDAFVDDLGGLRRAFDKVAGDGSWNRIKAANNAYKLGRLARGWQGKFEHMMEHGGWNIKTGQVDGSKGFMEIMRSVDDTKANKSLKEFTKFAVARRTLEKEGQFFDQRRDYRIELRDLKREARLYDDGTKDRYIIDKKIQKLEKDYKDKQLKRDNNAHTGMKHFENQKIVEELRDKYRDDWNNFRALNQSILRMQHQAGIISKQDIDNIKDANQHYIPFKRLIDDLDVLSRGGSPDGKPKNLEGSQRPLANPMEQWIKDVQATLRSIEHQTVLTSLRDWDTAGSILKKRPLKQDEKPIEMIAKQKGIRPDEVTAVDLITSVHGKDGKSVMYGYEDGKRVAYEVDTDLAKSFANLTDRETQVTHPVGKFLHKVAKAPAGWLRFGATTTPEFMMANMVRDLTASFVFSKKFTVPGRKMMASMTDAMKGNKSPEYLEMMRSGGKVMGRHKESEFVDDHLTKDIYEELSKRPVKNLLSIEKLSKFKDMASDMTEGATRMAEYRKNRDTGRLDAAFEARDTTLDFAKGGTIGRYINDVVTFHNAGVQGMNKLYNSMVHASGKERAAMMTKIFLGITVPSIAFNVAFGDDEMVKEAPQWERDLYWLIPHGDTLYRIPKPHELGVLFGSSVERQLDAMRGDKRAWDGYKKSLMEKLAIPDAVGSVVILKPFVEGITNHSSFRDAPLVPRHLEGILPEFQYTDATSETAKMISKVFVGINKESMLGSPIIVDNFIQAWTGGLSKHVTSGIDAMMQTNKVQPKHGEWGRLYDMPVIRAFIARDPRISSRARSIEAFRKRHEKALKEANTVSFLQKTFQFGDMRDVMSKNLWIKSDAAYQTMSELGTKIRMVNDLPAGSGGMDDEELAQWKSQTIDSMYSAVLGVAKNGLTAYDKIDEYIKEYN